MQNTLISMRCLLSELESCKESLKDEHAVYSNVISDHDENSGLNPTVAKYVQRLWSDPIIQRIWDRRSSFWHLDATPFYMENCHRFAERDYVPTDEDVIMARVMTTGITEIELNEDGRKFRIVDVGGQRNERRKWVSVFDNVKVMLFVVSLTGYNQVLFEDSGMNRMEESLKLFEQTVNSLFFQDKEVFIFFNKKD